MKTKTIKQDVDDMVREALAAGLHKVIESDPVRQHYLREHPNVCRQVLRYTQVYSIHQTPCGCPATPRAAKRSVELETPPNHSRCCFVSQPVDSECIMCGEVVK